MAVKPKAPLHNVIMDVNENIMFENSPEKIPYIINSCRDELPKFLFDVLFKLFFIPIIFVNVIDKLSIVAIIIMVALWIVYLIPTFLMVKIPFEKLREYKNIYYIVTDKAIYIQFGLKQIYYRIYPNDRIGTKVFYRQNRIDSMFNVGTLGFSVDDYYEERFVSVKDYESLYNVLKEVTNSRKEELLKRQEEREAKKREYEEMQKLRIQEEHFIQQREEEEERRRNERYVHEIQAQIDREQEEHEKILREHEAERQRMNEIKFDDFEENNENLSFTDFRKTKIQNMRSENGLNENSNDSNKPEESDDFDSYDLYGGAEIEVRPPSEKTIRNYNNRYATPSLAAHRKRANGTKRTFKNQNTNVNASDEKLKKANTSLDINKLWSSEESEEE